jgi:hypothetical protein
MALVVDLSQAVKNTHFVRYLDRDLARDLERIVRRKVSISSYVTLSFSHM